MNSANKFKDRPDTVSLWDIGDTAPKKANVPTTTKKKRRNEENRSKKDRNAVGWVNMR